MSVRNARSPCKNQEDRARNQREYRGRIRLSRDEVESAFRNDDQFPPLLSLDQAARLAHLAPNTIKRLASEGYFRNSVRRGKPIAFWRDRFVVEVMELDNSRRRNKSAKSKKGEQK
jgi:hypothetical protein